MTFTLDAQVAAVLAAAFERSGPPPAPPAGDVASRRVALDAGARAAFIAKSRALTPGYKTELLPPPGAK